MCIQTEMREDFKGSDVAGVMVREYCDRIEALGVCKGKVKVGE